MTTLCVINKRTGDKKVYPIDYDPIDYDPGNFFHFTLYYLLPPIFYNNPTRWSIDP